MLKPIGIQSVSRFTALVIGEAGIGKTSLIRTIPEGERACVLSAEAGLLCVQDMVIAGQIEGYEIGSFADLKEAYQMLLTPEFESRYQWVFIDSLTEVSGRCLESMKVKYVKSEDTFKMYGEYNDLMVSIIKGFRDMQKYSVVFSCLPSIEKDELNKRYVGAAIVGKQLQERLTSYFDEVLYLSQRSEEGASYRCFLTQPMDRYPAKDRSGKLSPIEQPNLAAIKTKILGKE